MYRFINLSLVTLLFIAGCASNQSSSSNSSHSESVSSATAAGRYCQDVDGQIKTVSSRSEEKNFCILPSGDVVDLEAFYQANNIDKVKDRKVGH